MKARSILGSVAIIAAASTLGYVGTTAYFSDTETSANNVLSTGTIDISVDGKNPWSMTNPYKLEDMKPGYTDFLEFTIRNEGENPADITQKLDKFTSIPGTVNEPECVAEHGTWDNTSKTCGGGRVAVNLSADQFKMDLRVEVFDKNPTDASAKKMWEQTIYPEYAPATISTDDVYLGMLPAGWYMKVYQSYHMDENAGNEYQGDALTFDINLTANQLTGTALLENKDISNEPWVIKTEDTIKGTLTYRVKGPTFKFDFSGKAPLVNHDYVLAAGFDSGTNVDTKLGTGTSSSDGSITITGDLDLNKDLKNVKVWLVPEENWNNAASGMVWTNWPSSAVNFLWETGLIWYDDTQVNI